MSFYEPHKSGSLIRIKLTPNAAKNAFGSEFFTDATGAEYLKASVTVAPEKGKANKELLKMLSKNLGLPVSIFEVISGQTDHLKKIFIRHQLDVFLEQKLALLKKEK